MKNKSKVLGYTATCDTCNRPHTEQGAKHQAPVLAWETENEAAAEAEKDGWYIVKQTGEPDKHYCTLCRHKQQ